MGTRKLRPAARPADAFRLTAGVLLVAVVVEFVLLRVVNRATGHLSTSVRDLIEGLALAGFAAYYVVLFLSMLLMLLAAWIRWRHDPRLSVLLVAWTIIAIGALIAGPTLATFVLLASLTFATTAFLVLRRVRSPLSADETSPASPWRHLLRFGSWSFPVLLLSTYASVLILQLSRLAPLPSGLEEPGIAAYGLGEVFAIGAALVAPFYVAVRPRRGALVFAIGVGVLASLVLLYRPDILALAAFWSVGLQMYLAVPVYAVAAAALAYALASSFRNPKTGYLFHGLLLVALAGRMLNDAYAVQLAMVAALLVLMPRDFSMVLHRPGARPVPEPEGSGSPAHHPVEVRV